MGEQHDGKVAGQCPVMHGSNTNMRGKGTENRDWWPNQLNLGILHQHTTKSNPMDEGSTTPRNSRNSTWPPSSRTSTT